MKIFSRLLSLIVLISIFAVKASASTPKILHLKDLQPGTKAIGFSVFKGTEPQPFDVVLGEAIDQMGDSFILARISGGPMDTPLERIGAIAGMSGSPIFVGCGYSNKPIPDKLQLEHCISEGTLVGALSYSIGYFLEGGMNCLLTPAEYMLGARVNGYVAASNFSKGPPNKINIGGKEFTNLMLFPKMENLAAGKADGRCQESVKSDIKPGSMVSVFLATGTFNIGGSGTVTWRDDDKIYIFGHSLFGSGMVRYPFVQVSVADTLQTPMNASKITGCSLDVAGAMFVDGAFEMAGKIGATASTLPYQVELHVGNGGGVLNEQIASSPWAAALIKALPVIWASQSLGDLKHYSLAYQMRINFADQPEIFARSIVPAQIYENPFGEVFDRVYSPIEALKESGFEYKVESIRVQLNFIRSFSLWSAKRSFLSQEKASPGETVYANIVLEEFFSSATKQISIPLKVPEDFMSRMGPGIASNINVIVQDGSKFTNKGDKPEINSAEDLIKRLNESMNRKTNVLYVQEIMPRSKVQQDADKAKAKSSVKPAWKWSDVGEAELKQSPHNGKDDVVLTLSPKLDDFVDLDLSFSLQVQAKKEMDAEKKEAKEGSKHRKWFGIF